MEQGGVAREGEGRRSEGGKGAKEETRKIKETKGKKTKKKKGDTGKKKVDVEDDLGTCSDYELGMCNTVFWIVVISEKVPYIAIRHPKLRPSKSKIR